jgi:hypothetical protein
MITLTSLIGFYTIVYWLRVWDRSIKTKTKINDNLPKMSGSLFFTLYLPTIFTSIILLYLILTYLP